MRFECLVVVFALLVAGRARAEPVPSTGELPIPLRCEAGYEESFGDRVRPFYTVELDRDSSPSSPRALLTEWLNDGARPFFTKVVRRARSRGKIQRRLGKVAVVTPSWTLSVSPGTAAPEAELLINGTKVAARCADATRAEPATPAVEFLRSSAFQERWAAARDALSDEYQLRYGPITTVASADRLSVVVALRKLHSHDCYSPERATPRLPFATVTATLRRAEDPTNAAGTRWEPEQIELTITDPAPPPADTPSAGEIAAALNERYGNARTLEARFRVWADSRGFFFPGRTSGVLRADATRGVSIRAEAYRQLELGGRRLRYVRSKSRSVAGPPIAYRLALPFLEGDLRDRFELERSRANERCSTDYVLVATPKPSEHGIERLILYVNRADLTIRSVEVTTPSVEFSVLFERQRVGVTLPDAEFDVAQPPSYEPGQEI